MSLNLASLQQKADQVIHNADKAIRKWQEFITAPAGTVQMQYYDQNGNLRTASFPNRNKVVNDFIGNVNSAMKKTFFVDTVNGNDANDGSQNAPFKTLQKAVDSVPVGGYGEIYIIGDYSMDENISIYYKHIIIIPKGTISSRVSEDSEIIGYAKRGGFILNNSTIRFYINSNNNAKIVLESNNTNLNFSPYYLGFINVNESSIYGYAYFHIRTYTDNYNPIIINDSSLVSIREWSFNRPSFIGVSVAGHHSGTNRHIIVNNGYLVHFQKSPGSIYINYEGGFKDGNGSVISGSSLVAGIVKDSNGVPRNIVSNIVL